MSHRVYPRLDHAPLDTELYQVKALFGRNAPLYGAAMQEFCDAYGHENAPVRGRFTKLDDGGAVDLASSGSAGVSAPR